MTSPQQPSPEPPQPVGGTHGKPLAGRAVLITGSTRGLGRALAERLAAAGADLAIVARSKADCEATAGDLASKFGVKAIGVEADLSQWQRASEVIDRALGDLGRLDVLINNVGTGSVQPIGQVDDMTLDEMFSVNLSSAMAMTRAALPALERSEDGRVVNISSVLGLVGREFRTTYCAAKGALIAFTRSLAVELIPRGITVNAIAPGQFYTSLTEGMWENTEKRESVTALIPAGRWGHPTELVEFVLPLLTERGRYMTGQTIVVDGGWSL